MIVPVILRARVIILGLTLITTACISPVDYGPIPHSQYVADKRCDPEPTQAPVTEETPYFIVTSRLPDCQNSTIKLTNHRGDKIRYGRFGDPRIGEKETGNAKLPIPFTISNEDQWWSALSKSMDNREGRALVYVHGYRETFRITSKDTAQIARLTGFTGPVIQYSWPSQGELLKYAVDETNMYWDERNFRRFLMKLAEQSWTREIVLISHSLGARLVIPAVEYVDKNSTNADSSNISNIILAAPDIDRQFFEREISEEILSERRILNNRRIVVYASSEDKAIGLSYRIHGYPRLGSPDCFDPFKKAALEQMGYPGRCYATLSATDINPENSGLTLIDSSAISQGTTGHSDFLRSAAACLDFASVVNGERDRRQGRSPTHLPHVFTLDATPNGEEPDHETICRRQPFD